MARIQPEQWAKFFDAWRTGHGKERAAALAGISMPTIRAGLRGDKGSSIHAYNQWRDTQNPCPTCGRAG